MLTQLRFMTFLLASLVCAALSLPACSLDSGGPGGGTSGIGSGGGGNSGSGGGSGISGSGGSTVPSFEDCQLIVDAQSGGRVPFACGFCLCSPQENRNTVTACDNQCWSLVECVGQNCGIGGAEQITCVSQNCSEFLGGVSTAQPISPLLQTCQPECGGLLIP